MRRGSISTVLFLLAAIVGARAAAAAPKTAVIGGRVTFRDASHTARPSEVERMRWGHITLELRHGWDVIPARLDENGLFTVTGPPGVYRVEYLKLGQLAEFFVPHDVEAKAGSVTCMGTLEVAVGDLKQDLGGNSGSELHVVDDCATLEPELARAGAPEGQVQKSLARPMPASGKPLTALDVLLAFRAGLDVSRGGVSSLRGNFVLPLGHDADWMVAASVTRFNASFVDERWPVLNAAPAKAAWGGTAGAGYRWWFVEMLAYGGYLGDPGRGAHGPMGGAQVRLGNFLFGLGGRLELFASGDSVGALTLDLSPVGLLGSLL